MPNVIVDIGVNATKLTAGLAALGGNVRSWASKLTTIPVFGTALAGAVGSVASTGALIHGVEGVIQKGAELNRLSRMTDMPVSELFQVQKGLSAIGADADAAAQMIYRLQKAMGGINEEGDPTKDVFERIGLDLRKLKQMSAAEQFRTVLQHLGTLPREEAAATSGKLFGRGAGLGALNLARNWEAFDDAYRAAASLAAIYQDQAAAMETTQRSAKKLSNIFQGFFLGITEGIMPVMEQAAGGVAGGTKLANKLGYALSHGYFTALDAAFTYVPHLALERKIAAKMLGLLPSPPTPGVIVTSTRNIGPHEAFPELFPEEDEDETKPARPVRTPFHRDAGVGWESAGARYAIFSGGLDHARETAQNTARMVQSLDAINRRAAERQMASRDFFLDDARRRGWDDEMNRLLGF